MRVLVLGGYGNFGTRICRAFAREGIEVVAAGRDPDRGHQSAKFDAHIGKAQIDIADKNLEARIRSITPDIVIHCAGPFQGQLPSTFYSMVRPRLPRILASHRDILLDGRQTPAANDVTK